MRGLLFYHYRRGIMRKPFLTYDEQFYKLTVEKELIISDESYARCQLQKIGYFALIGGYKWRKNHAGITRLGSV